MAQLFLEGRAAIQVRDGAALTGTVRNILTEADLAAELGGNAARIVNENSGATERVLRRLQPTEASR
jgi:hypothetical protein